MMFPVYFAFIEKGEEYVKTRGKSRFMPGDLFPTVLHIIQKYGILPETAYKGQVNYTGSYNHQALESEIEDFKARTLQENTWNREEILSNLKGILNKYLGSPPSSFNFQGNTYTPLSFSENFVDLPWKEYIIITSFSYAPFYQFVSLRVPDNWLNLNTYYNVPLDLFYQGMRTALSNGYSVAIDGDIHEPGRLGHEDICFIPEYDIPSNSINQQAREYRFRRGITEDDHLMHIVGYTEYEGEDWFLVKDSWRDAWQGRFKGYFMYHEDYARLKILAYLVHRDAIPEITKILKERLKNNK
jgi:bleomycin hydrolase